VSGHCVVQGKVPWLWGSVLCCFILRVTEFFGEVRFSTRLENLQKVAQSRLIVEGGTWKRGRWIVLCWSPHSLKKLTMDVDTRRGENVEESRIFFRRKKKRCLFLGKFLLRVTRWQNSSNSRTTISSRSSPTPMASKSSLNTCQLLPNNWNSQTGILRLFLINFVNPSLNYFFNSLAHFQPAPCQPPSPQLTITAWQTLSSMQERMVEVPTLLRSSLAAPQMEDRMGYLSGNWTWRHTTTWEVIPRWQNQQAAWTAWA